MRARITQYYEQISASYWFIPAILTLLASVLAFLLVQIDTRLEPDFFGNNLFFFATQPDGARVILGAIGSSMIGVAGTVFSITIATVVFASGSFGPRLITNFMNDRGNQFSLGVFLATFLYSTLVLRTVRDGPAGEGVFAAMFVPNLAIYGAIFLAIVSIGVLIFFLHHVPTNIHISNVIAQIGRSLMTRMDHMFPSEVGQPFGAEEREHGTWQVPPCFRGEAEVGHPPPYFELRAEDTGYIQVVDADSLIGCARENDVVVRLNCRPGTFVQEGAYLLDVWPAERMTPEAQKALLGAFALGSGRNPSQDIFFLIDELVEIAGRALSSGVNDPFTATTCLDWLGASYARIAGRTMPDPLRADEDGTLRLIAPASSFEDYLEHGFGRLRQYVATDRIASCRFLGVLSDLLPLVERPEELRAIDRQCDALLRLARLEQSAGGLEAVEEAALQLKQQMDRPSRRSLAPRSSADAG